MDTPCLIELKNIVKDLENNLSVIESDSLNVISLSISLFSENMKLIERINNLKPSDEIEKKLSTLSLNFNKDKIKNRRIYFLAKTNLINISEIHLHLPRNSTYILEELNFEAEDLEKEVLKLIPKISKMKDIEIKEYLKNSLEHLKA